MSNRFERAARTRKVRKIARTIRLASAGRQGNAGLVTAAMMMTIDHRSMVADAAGCNIPSSTTWSRVCLALGRTY